MLYSCYATQLDVPSRQTTPTRHIRVLDSSFRCLDKEGKRPQNVGLASDCYDNMSSKRLRHWLSEGSWCTGTAVECKCGLFLLERSPAHGEVHLETSGQGMMKSAPMRYLPCTGRAQGRWAGFTVIHAVDKTRFRERNRQEWVRRVSPCDISLEFLSGTRI